MFRQTVESTAVVGKKRRFCCGNRWHLAGWMRVAIDMGVCKREGSSCQFHLPSRCNPSTPIAANRLCGE